MRMSSMSTNCGNLVSMKLHEYLLERRMIWNRAWTCVAVDYEHGLLKLIDAEGSDVMVSAVAWAKFPVVVTL